MALIAQISAFLAKHAGWVFVATGPVRLCHDCVVQTWGFGPEGEVRFRGMGVLVVEGGGGEDSEGLCCC